MHLTRGFGLEHTPVLLGLRGHVLDADEVEYIQRARPVGFLLFARNIHSLEQVKLLCAELKRVCGDYQPLIAVDEEGGRVQRLFFKGRMPSAEDVGNVFALDKAKGTRLAWLTGALMAEELIDVGADTLLAPVLDLRHEGASLIIGDRAYSSDPAVVEVLARAFMDGVRNCGAFQCIKHAPGHGRALVDSHLGLPVIDGSLEDLTNDLHPFRALGALADFMMTAHIVFRALDAELPVTLSSSAISYLKKEFGFKGILLADDVAMKALEGDYVTRVEGALGAGCDVVICAMSVLRHGMAGTVFDEDSFALLADRVQDFRKISESLAGKLNGLRSSDTCDFSELRREFSALINA